MSIQGTVVFYHHQKKYGFIEYEDGEEKKQIFVHISNTNRKRALIEGQKVRFVIGMDKGKPVAERVEVLDAEIKSNTRTKGSAPF